MESFFVIASFKVSSSKEPYNFRISVDPNNFDDFMTEIKKNVSLFSKEHFCIVYIGTDGQKYCILHADDFQHFVIEKVERVFIEEIERSALPAQPAPPAHQIPPDQPDPPAKLSWRDFIYRAIGLFLPFTLCWTLIYFCDTCTGPVDYIDSFNGHRHVQLIVFNFGFLMFMRDIWKKLKNTFFEFIGSLPFLSV